MNTAQRPPAAPAPARSALPDPHPGQHALPGPPPFPHAQDGHDQHDGDHQHEGEGIPKDLPKVPAWMVLVVGIVAVAMLVGLFFIGWIPHRRQQAKLAADAKAAGNQLLIVDITRPQRRETTVELILPGDVRAMRETAMYPRANGYLKEWYVDINDHVDEGKLLAIISTPEVDAQLSQARAAVLQSEANVIRATFDNTLAQSTYARYQGLVATGGVTQQELDEKHSAADTTKANLAAAKANVTAAQADVQRLTELQRYERVIAPFSGTITARNYDNGALLSPTDLAPGHELFHLADTDTLRVFINVPQAYVTLVRIGSPAFLLVRNYQGREFQGTVTRSTGALDPATRTLRMEVDFPNKDHDLWAGMYGQVKFHLSQPQPPLIIPTSAMIFDAGGTKVAVVQGKGEQGKIHFQKIVIGRDFGTELEVTDGLSGGEQVVSNPGEKLAEGKEVKVAPPEGEGQNAEETAQAK